jgi:hypothetical protein
LVGARRGGDERQQQHDRKEVHGRMTNESTPTADYGRHQWRMTGSATCDRSPFRSSLPPPSCAYSASPCGRSITRRAKRQIYFSVHAPWFSVLNSYLLARSDPPTFSPNDARPSHVA